MVQSVAHVTHGDATLGICQRNPNVYSFDGGGGGGADDDSSTWNCGRMCNFMRRRIFRLVCAIGRHATGIAKIIRWRVIMKETVILQLIAGCGREHARIAVSHSDAHRRIHLPL